MIDRATAAAYEQTEARAWADLYAAAPADFAAAAGLHTRVVDGALVLSWAATGRRYFSRAIGLGIPYPATPAGLDEILAGWEREGIAMSLLASLLHCEPEGFEDLLRERGLEPFDAQDRVARGGQPFAPLAVEPEFAVAEVAEGDRDAWAEFLARTYGLDCEPWLRELHGRPGWHQYVAREDGRMVGARAMYIDGRGLAWLGMDGPVPGVMGDHYAADAAICTEIVRDGLARGARGFIADIEAPSETQDTPAYDYFGRLGFAVPYTRRHFARL